MIENARHEGDKLIVTGRRRVVLETRLADPEPGHAFGRCSYQEHDVAYEVSISASGLERMAETAFNSKGRRCQDGPVTVKILGSTPVGDRVETH